EHAHRGVPDVGAGAVALDEGDDGVIRHLELAVADGDLLACGDLDLHGVPPHGAGTGAVARARRTLTLRSPLARRHRRLLQRVQGGPRLEPADLLVRHAVVAVDG